jgi:hypothetical protein
MESLYLRQIERVNKMYENYSGHSYGVLIVDLGTRNLVIYQEFCLSLLPFISQLAVKKNVIKRRPKPFESLSSALFEADEQ